MHVHTIYRYRYSMMYVSQTLCVIVCVCMHLYVCVYPQDAHCCESILACIVNPNPIELMQELGNITSATVRGIQYARWRWAQDNMDTYINQLRLSGTYLATAV